MLLIGWELNLLSGLWLQMTSPAQYVIAYIQTILSSVFYCGIRWRHVIHLYLY